MNITGGIIIVKLDDDKAYQVDISSESVLMLLKYYQIKTNETIGIIDKPLIGLTLTKNVLKST